MVQVIKCSMTGVILEVPVYIYRLIYSWLLSVTCKECVLSTREPPLKPSVCHLCSVDIWEEEIFLIECSWEDSRDSFSSFVAHHSPLLYLYGTRNYLCWLNMPLLTMVNPYTFLHIIPPWLLHFLSCLTPSHFTSSPHYYFFLTTTKVNVKILVILNKSSILSENKACIRGSVIP